MLKDYIALALKNLLRRRLRSWLTLIGVCIGIATVVALVGLGEGLREGVLSQFGFLGPDVISVQAESAIQGPPGFGAANPLTIRQLERVQTVSGVKTAFGRVIQNAVVTYRGESRTALIASIPDSDVNEFYRTIGVQERNVESGRLLRAGETNRVLLGYNFGQDQNRFQRGVESGRRITVNDKQYEVVGILDRQGTFTLDDAVLMLESEMRDSFDRDETLDVIAVVAQNIGDVDRVRDSVEQVLRRERNVREGEEDFSVETAATRLDSLEEILSAVNIFIVALASISIIVGSIGIANTMFTSVLERTNQIGIMKAVGAKNKDIFYIFFIESGLLGIVGGIIGITIGLAIAFAGAFAASAALGEGAITTTIDIPFILIILAGSFAIGAISGIIPAYRASKLVPVDALRYGK